MVTINVNLDRVLDQDSSANLTGKQRLEVSYLRLQLDGDAKRVLTTDAITWDLTDGVGSFKVDVTPELNAIQVIGRGFRPGFRMCFQVSADDDGKDLSELTPIDPTTLDPLEPASPAWLAQVAELKDQIDTKADTNSLASVATSGQYGDLAGTPTLGTAAAADATDFATAAQGSKADTAVQPAGVDAAVAAEINDSGSDTAQALTAKIAPFGSGIATTARKLADDVNDVTVLVIGDSTASSPSGQFPEFLMPMIQQKYPHRTLQKHQWDDSAKTYGSPSQVGPSGTGSNFIHYYAGGVGGTIPETNQVAWESYVAAVQPDLVIVHFGHNYGKDATAAGVASNFAMDEQFRERMLRLVLRIKDSCPDADVMINSQNPYLTAGARAGVSSVRAQIIRGIAADLGCAYGPVCEAFIATGDPASYLQGDLLHPTIAGATNGALLTAETLVRQFEQNIDAPMTARVPSPLSSLGKQLLSNGDLTDFASPPTLAGWTASAQATLTKETTIYEGIKGYSVKITATGGGYATIYQTLPVRSVREKWVTVAARLFVPTGATVEAGRLRISGDGGLVTANSGGISAGIKNQWVWAFATARVPAAATFSTVTIYGGFTAGDITYVDRISSSIGTLPRDVA